MKLSETVELMNSEDYKDRFKAEYLQILIRTQSLGIMLENMRKDKLNFKPKCRYTMLRRQYDAMEDYGYLLEQRAKIEGIELISTRNSKKLLING